MPKLYADPELYDLIHAEGTREEVRFLDLLAHRHGSGGKAALEPACGTGRYLAGLLELGWSVTGYDRSPAMLAFARKRLKGWGKRVRLSRGEMASFRAPESADLIFNLISTFRHLLSERQALAHLRRCREALKPGGVLILGLDLASYGQHEPDEDVWAGRGFSHVVMALPPQRRLRRERIVNFIQVDGRKPVESAYDLRTYDAAEIRETVLKAGLTFAAVYSQDGDPVELGGEERVLWLVLKARA